MTSVPEDDAARREPSAREGSRRDGAGDVVHAQGSGAGASDPQTLASAAADRVRWVAVVATLVAAGALLLAQDSGYAATLGATLVLALALAWGWPLLTGSRTPAATSGVLAVSSVAIVLSALRQDLLWVPAAVAFGIVLSFFAQLVRSSREGLVQTLLSSFGGLVVVASGATAVVAANSARGQAVAVVAMAAVAAAVVADLLVGVRRISRWLVVVALLAALVAALVAVWRSGEVGTPEALAIGAVAGCGSWAFRRVFSLEPAMLGLPGQVAAATGSVLAVGALVRFFSLLT
jgi:hypothetical protein